MRYVRQLIALRYLSKYENLSTPVIRRTLQSKSLGVAS